MKYDEILRLDPADPGFEKALADALRPFGGGNGAVSSSHDEDPEISSLSDEELISKLIGLTGDHRALLAKYIRPLKLRAAEDRMTACLLGGAIGDALGTPIEYMNWDNIVLQYGKDGITDMPFGGEVSDETQLTLFTAEAVTRCADPADWIRTVRLAYQRWYYTQTFEKVGPEQDFDTGLTEVRDMYAHKIASDTVIHMLSRGHLGTISSPHNMSKGCAAIVRVAPCCVTEDPFMRAAEAAAVTHDHPSGYLSAGAFALILSRLMRGETLTEAIEAARAKLLYYRGHQEVLAAIDDAVKLAKTDPGDRNLLEQKLGGGWTSEETLSIALYCALSHPDSFRDAVLLSVNHSGDSDSTGSVCGNIMGMALGMGALPEKWYKWLELDVQLKSFGKKLTEHAVSRGTIR